MTKRKMKQGVKYIFIALVLIAAITVVFTVINNSRGPKADEQKEYHGQIIQDENDAEIIIPDELETDGF